MVALVSKNVFPGGKSLSSEEGRGHLAAAVHSVTEIFTGMAMLTFQILFTYFTFTPLLICQYNDEMQLFVNNWFHTHDTQLY